MSNCDCEDCRKRRAATVMPAAPSDTDLMRLAVRCGLEGALSGDGAPVGAFLANFAREVAALRPTAPKPAPTEALEFLFLAILTRADKDYLDRAMRRSDAALRAAMPGWNPPFDWSGA